MQEVIFRHMLTSERFAMVRLTANFVHDVLSPAGLDPSETTTAC